MVIQFAVDDGMNGAIAVAERLITSRAEPIDL